MLGIKLMLHDFKSNLIFLTPSWGCGAQGVEKSSLSLFIFWACILFKEVERHLRPKSKSMHGKGLGILEMAWEKVPMPLVKAKQWVHILNPSEPILPTNWSFYIFYKVVQIRGKSPSKYILMSSKTLWFAYEGGRMYEILMASLTIGFNSRNNTQKVMQS